MKLKPKLMYNFIFKSLYYKVVVGRSKGNFWNQGMRTDIEIVSDRAAKAIIMDIKFCSLLCISVSSSSGVVTGQGMCLQHFGGDGLFSLLLAYRMSDFHIYLPSEFCQVISCSC